MPTAAATSIAVLVLVLVLVSSSAGAGAGCAVAAVGISEPGAAAGVDCWLPGALRVKANEPDTGCPSADSTR